MNTLVEANDVAVGFMTGALARKRIEALRGVSFTVRAGEVFALVGPNGSGKSTLLYILLGLIRPDRGRVTLLGRRPEPGDPVFEHVAYLPEEPCYHPYMTPRELLTALGEMYPTPVPGERVEMALARAGALEFADRRIGTLSKGMKQKAGLALCMLPRAKVVLLDEPTRGLDPIGVMELRDMVRSMTEDGAAVIMNSHVLSEVESMADRVAIMNNGVILTQESLGAPPPVGASYQAAYYSTAPDDGPPPEWLAVAKGRGGRYTAVFPEERLLQFAQLAERMKWRPVSIEMQTGRLEKKYVHAITEKEEI